VKVFLGQTELGQNENVNQFLSML